MRIAETNRAQRPLSTEADVEKANMAVSPRAAVFVVG